MSAEIAVAGGPRFDPLRFYEDPYPVYRRLREEAPVYRCAERDCWVLSRFADVQATARDWETFSSAEGDDLDDTSLLFAPSGETAHADPPVHTRLRGAVRAEFGVKAVRERLGPGVREEARRLVDAISGEPEVDLVARLALPLPGTTVCSWLGFPRSDHDLALGWFRAMSEREEGELALPASAFAARDAMREYTAAALVDRRRRPRADLLTAFAAAVEEGALSTDDALGMTTQLFFAGITTTAALIGGALANLHRFPAELGRLRDEPELIAPAVEELLRFDPPVQWLTRVTTRAVELHGAALPAGARVLMIWASANRDERRWERSEELDLRRRPQRHLSFGEGIHHCLGAPLARLEASALFAELLPRLRAYEPAAPIRHVYAQSERTIEHWPALLSWA